MPRPPFQICKNTGFDPYALAGFLDADQQEQLRVAAESYADSVPLWMLNRQRDLENGQHEIHLTGQQVQDSAFKTTSTALKPTECYRGVRHASGSSTGSVVSAVAPTAVCRPGCQPKEVMRRNQHGRAKVFTTEYDTPSHPWKADELKKNTPFKATTVSRT